jgi:hypothetical protein
VIRGAAGRTEKATRQSQKGYRDHSMIHCGIDLGKDAATAMDEGTRHFIGCGSTLKTATQRSRFPDLGVLMATGRMFGLCGQCGRMSRVSDAD